MITKAVAMVALLVATTSSVVAQPCDGAEQGTYESNVCWLMETNFDEVTPKVMLFLVQAQVYEESLRAVGETLTDEDRRALEDLTIINSLNEEDCTVTYTTLGDQNTVRFNRVQPSMIVWEQVDNVVKYTLRGDGFSSDNRKEVVFFSDNVTPEASERAMATLYGRYCEGTKGEF